MVVCPINKNHLNRCFTKSFGRGQPAEAPTHNHHAGCARFPGVSFRHRDVIRLRHRSVLFFYFFLKLLSAQISKNLGFMASLDVEECPSEGGLTKSWITRLSDDDSAVLVFRERKFSLCQCFS